MRNVRGCPSGAGRWHSARGYQLMVDGALAAGVREGELLWSPSPAQCARTNLAKYQSWLAAERGLHFGDYDALRLADLTDPSGVLHAAGNETFDTQGGTNEQVTPGKILWKASDSVTATFTADWTHTNQPSTANTVLESVTSGPTAVFGAIYNACLLDISTTS